MDLIVIGDISGRELAQLLIPAKEAMGREINPITMTPSELRKKAQGGHAFPKRVLGEPMIFLIGGEDELRDVSDGGPPPSASDLAD